MLITLSDTRDPRLAPYLNLSDAQLRALDLQAGRSTFIAEGELVVRALLASRYPVHSLLVNASGRERMADVLAGLPVDTPVFEASNEVLEAILGFAFHRGVLACGVRVPPPSVEEVVKSSRVLVILENTANTDNMGAVFRNLACLAGRGAGVLLSPGCCDPLYRKALRVSIGHALRVPFATLEAWPEGLGVVEEAGFTLTALTPRGSAVAITDLSPNGGPEGRRYALVLGAEGPGLTEGALERCGLHLRIPMAEGADSLNVATAAAVALSRLVTPQ